MVDSPDCPRSRDRDRRHAAQPIAAIGGAGRHDFRAAGGTTGATRCPSRALGLQVIAARAGRSTVENAVNRAVAGLAVRHADGRPRSTLRSTSRPKTASASPGRSPRPPSIERLQRFRAVATGGRDRRRMAAAPSAPGLNASSSSTVTVSAVRSWSFVVFGDACPAIC